jgi:3-mercaptopyruvate sulfurtransferase SseA
MNTRAKFSMVLVSMGLILAFLPFTGNRSLSVKPADLLSEMSEEGTSFTVDQVARFVVSEDSTVRIIDLRSPEEFNSFSIPGSVNVPYDQFTDTDPRTFFGSGDVRNILYSNGDLYSNYALVIAKGMNFRNVYVMKGGLNEWFETVMNSSFTGERITPRENALFETRSRAKRLFTEMNSLPDSLKSKLLEAKKLEAQKLDGGCE